MSVDGHHFRGHIGSAEIRKRRVRPGAGAVDSLLSGLELAQEAAPAHDRHGKLKACLYGHIHQRIDHVYAFTAGFSATELAPRSKAARELEALFAWITQGALL